MGVGKKILLVFLSLLLVVVLLLSSSLWTANKLLYPEVYIESFEENNVYVYFDNLTSEIPGGELIILPEEGLKPVVDNSLINFLSYMRGDTEELELKLDLASGAL